MNVILWFWKWSQEHWHFKFTELKEKEENRTVQTYLNKPCQQLFVQPCQSTVAVLDFYLFLESKFRERKIEMKWVPIEFVVLTKPVWIERSRVIQCTGRTYLAKTQEVIHVSSVPLWYKSALQLCTLRIIELICCDAISSLFALQRGNLSDPLCLWSNEKFYLVFEFEWNKWRHFLPDLSVLIATGVVLFQRPSHTSPNWPEPNFRTNFNELLSISHWSRVRCDNPSVTGFSIYSESNCVIVIEINE